MIYSGSGAAIREKHAKCECGIWYVQYKCQKKGSTDKTSEIMTCKCGRALEWKTFKGVEK